MPGWHAKTKTLQSEGKLQIVGIIEEQHPDRTRLFMQWKEMGWPLLIDSLNLLDVSAVPLTYLIDEAGIVRYERPSDEDLEVFLETDYSDAPGQGRTLDVAEDSPEQALLWGGDVSAAISGLHRRVAAAPEDARAHFPLGVAYRKRYDSEARKPEDFAKAVEHWVRALELDPNQYIFRRRIQQYGPRLDKPYPFYDWVPEARVAIEARGETAVALAVEPRGAEFAEPVKASISSGSETEPPDPEGRIFRDEAPLIGVETVTVPSKVAPGDSARVHVVFRPDLSKKAHWNNEVDDTAHGVSGRIEKSGEDPVAASVLSGARPDDERAAARGPGYPGAFLAVRGDGVRAKLASETGAGGVEDLSEDACTAAVLTLARPHDDEVPRGSGGHDRLFLSVRREAVDDELCANGKARGIVQPSDDAKAASVLPRALPDDYESSADARGHGRKFLSVHREHVDLELATDRSPHGREPLAEDSRTAPVLLSTFPDHDEVPGAVGRDGRPGRLGGKGAQGQDAAAVFPQARTTKSRGARSGQHGHVGAVHNCRRQKGSSGTGDL